MLNTNGEITEFNNSGSYDYSKKKKKNIYYEEEGLGPDDDNDGMPDRMEEAAGIHRNGRHIRNHPGMARHFSLGNSLPTTKSGIGGVNHTFLKPIRLRGKVKKGKMRLTMNEPKKFNLSLDIKQPKMSFSLKDIKNPKMEIQINKKIKKTENFQDDYINKFLERMGVKKKGVVKKKKGLFQW